MYKEFKEKVIRMNEELEDVDYVSAELLEQFYQLENDLEEGSKFCFEYEEEKMKKLIKRLRKIKSNNDII